MNDTKKNVIRLVLVIGAVLVCGVVYLAVGRSERRAAGRDKPAESAAAPALTTGAPAEAKPPSEGETDPRTSAEEKVATQKTPPAMNDMLTVSTMVSVQRKILEGQFGNLMDDLQFSSEERAEFMRMLTDARTNQMTLVPALMSSSTTGEERERLMKQVKDGEAELDGKVRKFLKGDASYDYYRTYVDQQPDRSQVKSLQANCRSLGQPLGADQAKALTAIMFEERKTSMANSGQVDSAKGGLQAITSAEAVDARRESLRIQQEQVAMKAAAILTPEQLAALKEQQQKRLQAVGKMSKPLNDKLGP